MACRVGLCGSAVGVVAAWAGCCTALVGGGGRAWEGAANTLMPHGLTGVSVLSY